MKINAVVYWGVPLLLALPVEAASLTVSLTPKPANTFELAVQTETGFGYWFEASGALSAPNWQPISSNRLGDGAILRLQQTISGASRFFRAVRVAQPTISPNAVAPMAGQLYPQGAILGAQLLGLQFSIPARWKGAVRDGTSMMLFGSDTEPGLAVAFISLAGGAPAIAAQLGQSFATDAFGGFSLTKAPVINGATMVIEWAGYGTQYPALIQLRGVVHPSGGVVAFAGLFLEANRAVIQRVLDDFVASTVTVPRQTRADLVTLISGKAFSWAKSTSVGGGGGSGSLSSWSQNNAYFCPGTYEISTFAETTYSGNLSGGAFYTGGSSNNSTEVGDWTIVDSPSGPVMVMVSSSGFQAALFSVVGNSVLFGDQQFDYSGPRSCP